MNTAMREVVAGVGRNEAELATAVQPRPGSRVDQPFQCGYMAGTQALHGVLEEHHRTRVSCTGPCKAMTGTDHARPFQPQRRCSRTRNKT